MAPGQHRYSGLAAESLGVGVADAIVVWQIPASPAAGSKLANHQRCVRA